MHLFHVTESLNVDVGYYMRGSDASAYRIRRAGEAAGEPPGSRLRIRIEAPPDGRPRLGDLHLANSPVFFRALKDHQDRTREAGAAPVATLLAPESRDRVLSRSGLPRRLATGAGPGAEPPGHPVSALGRGRSVRLAVVNIFHQAFGDTLASLCALRELRRILAGRFSSVRVDLFQHRCNRESERLYHRSGLVDGIVFLPAPLRRLAAYDAFLDLTRARARPGAHWMDLCLRAFGLDPGRVPPSRKRMSLPRLPEVPPETVSAVRRARSAGGELLLVHPVASDGARTMPGGHAARFVDAVLRRTPWTIASAVPMDVEHDRFVDWSPLSTSFDRFCYLVSQADLVASVDTCTYHVADALDVPGVALFTTVRPETRVAHYPYIRGIAVGAEGASGSAAAAPAGAPDGDVAPDAWDTLDPDRVIDALEAARRERASARPSAAPTIQTTRPGVHA